MLAEILLVATIIAISTVALLIYAALVFTATSWVVNALRRKNLI